MWWEIAVYIFSFAVGYAVGYAAMSSAVRRLRERWLWL